MHKIFWFCLLLCCSLPLALANKSPPLYQIALPVATDDAAVREAAFAQALEQVLIKVSGNSQIQVKNPALNTLKASNLVASYRYEKLENTSVDVLPFILTVTFQEQGIQDSLKKTGQIAWTSDRSAILAWITIQDQQGARLLTSDLDNSLLQASQRLAEKRGISLALPLLDLATLNQISVSDINNNRWDLIEKASAPYQRGATLLLQMIQNIDGTWTTHSQLLLDRATQEWTLSGADKTALLIQTLNTVMDAFAEHYTALLAAPDNTIALQINQISTLEQSVQLQNLLAPLSLITQINVTEVTPSSILLSLKIKGEKTALKTALASSNQLAPADNSATADLLTYTLKAPAT
jgi:hypothetical protein